MKKKPEQKRNRREIFTGIFRWATLGFIGAGAGFITVKRRRLVKEGKCINKGICRGCGVFDECGLPQALSAKQVLSGNING